MRVSGRATLMAAVVGAAGAAAAFALGSSIPPGWVAALMPGVGDATEVAGGARVEIENAARLDAAACDVLAERIDRIGGRLVGEGGCPGAVELAGVGPDAATVLLEETLRPGRLELVDVVERSDFMRALHALASDDDTAEDLGVRSEIDFWKDAAGEDHHDWYLTAADPSALWRYLDHAARADPSVAPPAELRVALERRDFLDAESAARPFRTYLVRREAVLSNRDVASAERTWNPVMGYPEVTLALTDGGSERLAEWTDRIAGHKVGILLDGEVTSAPVVQESIDRGRFSLLTPRGGSGTAALEAEALAAVLSTSPLAEGTGLRAAGAVAIARTVSDGTRQIARALMALLFGLALALPLWLLERRAARIDPAVRRVPDAPGAARAWGAAAVTVAVVAIAAVAVFVRVPWVSRDDVDLLTDPDALGSGPFSVFALGVQPFLVAFVAVEIAAQLVPRWRPLRTGGPTDRARLGVAVAVVGCAITLAHAWVLARWYAGLGAVEASGFHAGLDVQVSVPFATMTIAGGVTALVVLALFADRHGLVNGFAAVIAGGFALEAIDIARWVVRDDVEAPARLATVGGIALAAIATAAALRWQARPAAAARFRVPTAGLIPLGATAAVYLFLEAVPAPWASATTTWLWDRTESLVVAIGILVLLSLALSWLFSRPSRLGPAVSIDPVASRRAWRAFGSAALVSALYLAALLAVERALAAWADVDVPVVMTALATAIAMDAVAEWRARRRRGDLVPVWPLHHVQRADVAVAALARSGIDVHARGVYLRSLLHIAGSWVPILVFVPAGQVDEARSLLKSS